MTPLDDEPSETDKQEAIALIIAGLGEAEIKIAASYTAPFFLGITRLRRPGDDEVATNELLNLVHPTNSLAEFGRRPKLTLHQQKEAIARRQTGASQAEIAKIFNANQSTISPAPYSPMEL